MASRKKKVSKAVPFSASDLQNITKANPYIQRLMEDSELRDNITTVIDSSKDAYARVLSAKKPQKAVFEDKKLHKQVSKAAEAVKDVANALNDAPKKKNKKKKRHLGRKLLFALLPVGVLLAVSDSARSKVLDTLFGKEEEFEYTPPAPAPETPPTPPADSSPVSAA